MERQDSKTQYNFPIMVKVIAPIHCEKPAKPYAKLYGRKGRAHSIESGFRCEERGQIRIPSGQVDFSDMATMDSIREAGILFDEKLSLGQI